MSNLQPLIGVGVCLIKDDQVLLGLRKGDHGQNTWGFPGGHLEFGETPKQCAIREVKEETGLDISGQQLSLGPWTNDYFKQANSHYITLFLLVKHPGGQPQIIEPHKILNWNWFNWSKLPTPLFLPVKNLIKTGFDPLNSPDVFEFS